MRDISNSSFINCISMSITSHVATAKVRAFLPSMILDWFNTNSCVVSPCYHALPSYLIIWLIAFHYHFISCFWREQMENDRWRRVIQRTELFCWNRRIQSYPQHSWVWRAGSVAFCPHPVTWWCWISSHIAGCYLTISFFHLTHFFHKKQVLM